MSWKIWYDDETSYASWDGLPEDAPAEGVQMIAEKRAGRTLLHNMGEVYIWDGVGWESASEAKENWPEGTVVLRGRLMDTKKFKTLREEAMLWLHPDPY